MSYVRRRHADAWVPTMYESYVVDGNSLIHVIFNRMSPDKKRAVLLFGEWGVLWAELHVFLGAWGRRINAVVIDGLHPKANAAVLARRRKQVIDRMAGVAAAVRFQAGHVGSCDDVPFLREPDFRDRFAEQCMEYDVRLTSLEADDLVSVLALHSRGTAVMSNDSDFMAYRHPVLACDDAVDWLRHRSARLPHFHLDHVDVPEAQWLAFMHQLPNDRLPRIRSAFRADEAHMGLCAHAEYPCEPVRERALRAALDPRAADAYLPVERNGLHALRGDIRQGICWVSPQLEARSAPTAYTRSVFGRVAGLLGTQEPLKLWYPGARQMRVCDIPVEAPAADLRALDALYWMLGAPSSVAEPDLWLHVLRRSHPTVATTSDPVGRRMCPPLLKYQWIAAVACRNPSGDLRGVGKYAVEVAANMNRFKHGVSIASCEAWSAWRFACFLVNLASATTGLTSSYAPSLDQVGHRFHWWWNALGGYHLRELSNSPSLYAALESLPICEEFCRQWNP